MHCSDLERYLEAHLDGRLGRNRSAILQRHLSSCTNCCKRVEDLRRFEQDLHGKFRTMRAAATLWDTLETALVSTASSKPVAKTQSDFRDPVFLQPTPAQGLNEAASHFRPVGNKSTETVAGSAPTKKIVSPISRWLMAATGLMLVGITSIWAFENYRTHALLATLTGVEPGAGSGMKTDDVFILRNWLGRELGYPMPQPPMPQGFQLTGGSVVDRETGSSAVISYESETGLAVLHMRMSDPAVSYGDLAQTHRLRGMQAETWSNDLFDYAVFAGPDVMGLERFLN